MKMFTHQKLRCLNRYAVKRNGNIHTSRYAVTGFLKQQDSLCNSSCSYTSTRFRTLDFFVAAPQLDLPLMLNPQNRHL